MRWTQSPHVESCVVHQHGAIDAIVLSQFDTLVYSALPPTSSTTGPEVAAARALFARLAAALADAGGHHLERRRLYTEPSERGAGRRVDVPARRQERHRGRVAGGRTPEPPDRRALRRRADDTYRASPCGGARRRGLFQRPAHRSPGDHVPRSRSDHSAAESCRSGRRRVRAKLAIEHRASGVFNVAPAAGIPLKAALKAARVPRVPLGRLAQNGVRSIASSASLSAPPDQLRYIQYSWTVSGAKLKKSARVCADRDQRGRHPGTRRTR